MYNLPRPRAEGLGRRSKHPKRSNRAAINFFDRRSRYPYRPLEDDSRSIRLLVLEPAETKESPVQCRLVTHRLDLEAPQTDAYDALSYTWGGIDEEHDMIIDGQYTLPITGNLFQALIRLRSTSVPRALWVDAVCINQADEIDKTQQISIMRNIYYKAQCVIVWLGVEEDDSSLAMDYLNQRDRIANTRLTDALRSAFYAFFTRPWFCRVWILQEIATARQLKILCGESEVTDSVFCRQVKNLLEDRDRDLREFEHYRKFFPDYRRGWRDDNDIDNHRDILTTTINLMSRVHIKAFPLNRLLDKFRFRKATISHDLVFALTGMSHDADEAPELRAQYQISWSELLRNAFLKITEAPKSLETSMHFGQLIISSEVKVIGQVRYGDVKERIKGGTFSKSVTVTYSYPPLGRHTSEYDYEFDEYPFVKSLIRRRFFKCQFDTDLSIKEGDCLCLLAGVRNPVFLRLADDHVAFVATMPRRLGDGKYQEWLQQQQDAMEISDESKHHIQIVWHWNQDDSVRGDSPGRDRSRAPDANVEAKTVPWAPWQRRLPVEKTLAQKLQMILNHICLLQDFGFYEGADRYLGSMIALYEPADSILHTHDRDRICTGILCKEPGCFCREMYQDPMQRLQSALARDPTGFGTDWPASTIAESFSKVLNTDMDTIIDQIVCRTIRLEESRVQDRWQMESLIPVFSARHLLAWAIRKGAERFFRRLLAEPFFVQSTEQLSDIVRALIKFGDLTGIKDLLHSTSHKIRLRNKLLEFATFMAIKQDRVLLLIYLSSHGFNLNTSRWRETGIDKVIAKTVTNKDSVLLEPLLDFAGDSYVVDEGLKLFPGAINQNRVDIAHALIERGVSVNEDIGPKRERPSWASGISRHRKYSELVEFLWANGAFDVDYDEEFTEESDHSDASEP